MSKRATKKTTAVITNCLTGKVKVVKAASTKSLVNKILANTR